MGNISSQGRLMNRVTILDIPIDIINHEQVLQKIDSYIQSGRPHQIVTVNPEFVIESLKNDEFKQVLQQADLSLADGSGVFWAARLRGNALPSRITGADLAIDLAKFSELKNWRLYLVGAGPNIAKQASQKLKEHYPNIRIVGAEEGLPYRSDLPKEQWDKDAATNLIKRVNAATPDILLVAFGAPKQDLFIARYKDQLSVPVMIGVGGTLDFLAGNIARAPKFLRALSLEWLWRLIHEPKRWKRIYRAVILFPIQVIIHPKQ